MFRHTMRQSTRIGALSESAASAMAGSVAGMKWKGVQNYGNQLLTFRYIGRRRGKRVMQRQF